MRVLFVCNYKPGCGGISGQVALLHEYLTSEGIHSDIFSTRGNPFKRVILLLKLKHIAARYDIIHAHGCSGWGFLPIAFAVLTGRKVVATYHGGGAGSFFTKRERIVRKYLQKTETNIVLSGYLAKVFEQYHLPYVVIPNIVEPDPSVYRLRNIIHPNFISIRTLSPLYNIECIIDAFAQVKKVLADAKLVIVGDGPSRKSLEERVKRMDLSDVSFVGRIQNNKIYEYLDSTDVMLSSPHVDNMPVSILEAFNAGLLVISSSVGGVPYMINDGMNGLLFGDGNSFELAEKMLWAVSHQEESKRMILSARDDLATYTWPGVKDELMKIYSDKK